MLFVDTDALLVAPAMGRDDVPRDAAIDTLRIDVLSAELKLVATHVVTAPDPLDWPISFGVTPGSANAETVLVRLRAFRANLAGVETVEGAALPIPPSSISIDRLVAVPMPDSDVRRLGVRLYVECLGRTPSLSTRKSCVDGDRLNADASAGLVVADSVADTRAGTWSGLAAEPCKGSGPVDADAICIPGGFSVMGDSELAGLSSSLMLESTPPRPVRLSPFWLDKTEVTVGRFRKLVQDGFAGELPLPPDPSSDYHVYCTWLGVDDASNDSKPLTCLSIQTAELACQAWKGLLPTEAQWEHAARGRGQGRLFPWGDAPFRCCAASVNRHVPKLGTGECPGDGPEDVGSHPVSAGCDGVGDESRDGIVDLAGSVQEVVRDTPQNLSGSCWARDGIQRDPVCAEPNVLTRVARGAGWNMGSGNAQSAVRYRNVATDEAGGFRCAYPDGAAP